MADDYLGTLLTTGNLAIGDQVSGVIEKIGDQDWFAVDLIAGTSYNFYGYDLLSRGGALLGIDIALYNPSGSILYSAGASDTINYTASVSGRYFLSAKGSYAAGTYASSGIGSYKLRAAVAVSDDYQATAQTAGALTVGGEVRGIIETVGDRDWFAMDLEAGKSYRFAGYDSLSYGGTVSGVFLTLRTASGTSVANSNIDDTIDFKPSISGRFFLEASGSLGQVGTYLLQALEVVADDYKNTEQTTGVLAIGGRAMGVIGMPGDKDWFAVDLEAGKTYQFDGFDMRTGGGTLPDIGLRLHTGSATIPLAAATGKINFTPKTSGRYYLGAESATLNDRGSYTLTATLVAGDEFPSSTMTTGALSVGGRTTGVIGVAGDVDWFAVDLVAGRTYRFDGLGSSDGGGTLFNVSLALKDPSGGSIAGINLTDGSYTPTVSGRYFLAAAGYGTDTGTYTLKASGYGPPSLSVSSHDVSEAKGSLIYLATLSETSTTPVTFLAKTSGGTATAGTDYIAISRTVTIAAGATSATIEVGIKDDSKVEADETVILTLSNITGTTLSGTLSASGTILNDDVARAAFTVDAYRTLNPDLLAVFGADDAAYVRHYANNGRAEGRASTGFDSDAYAALNPDLLRAFGLDPLALGSHYLAFGRAEGRSTEGFDAEAYAAKNPDLFAAFGTDHRSLINHYVNLGRTEGRVASGFDAEAYAALNPDLFTVLGLDANRLINHYINNGRVEGRATTGFDAETYAALNPDLMAAFGLNHAALINHYINSGRAEGRSTFLLDKGAAAPAMLILDVVGVTADLG